MEHDNGITKTSAEKNGYTVDGIETFHQNKIANGFNTFFLLKSGLNLHL